MPEQTGQQVAWGLNLSTAFCRHCDWHYLLSAEMLPIKCPYCFQENLEAIALDDDSASIPPPELLLPFSVSADKVSQSIERFAKGIWFAPGDLKPATLNLRLSRLYLPMWLVDGYVDATWQAEAGFNYDAISHRENFTEGGWQSQQITETRIRWEARAGRLHRTYHNIPAPALEEHFKLMEKLGQYRMDAGRPYQKNGVNGSIIRLPNRSTTDAWPDTTPAFQTAAADECRTASQADHLREFRWSTTYHNKNWTLLLLPAYVTYYMDDDHIPQPVLIHGQTGQLSAPRRASMKQARKLAVIIVAVAAVIFTISLILGIVSILIPPLLIVAGLGVILAVIIGMMAVVPLVIVWQMNHT